MSVIPALCLVPAWRGCFKPESSPSVWMPAKNLLAWRQR